MRCPRMYSGETVCHRRRKRPARAERSRSSVQTLCASSLQKAAHEKARESLRHSSERLFYSLKGTLIARIQKLLILLWLTHCFLLVSPPPRAETNSALGLFIHCILAEGNGNYLVRKHATCINQCCLRTEQALPVSGRHREGVGRNSGAHPGSLCIRGILTGF